MAVGPKLTEPAKAAILESALCVLMEHGYGAASMDAVAEAAGVSRRTLFNKFETKEALFNAALQHHWRCMQVRAIVVEPASLADVCDAMARIANAIADFLTAPKAIGLIRLIVCEGSRFPSLGENYLWHGKVPAFKALSTYIRKMNKAGELRVPHPEIAARQFVGSITEPLVWTRVLGFPEREPAFRAHVIDEAVKTFLARYRS